MSHNGGGEGRSGSLGSATAATALVVLASLGLYGCDADPAPKTTLARGVTYESLDKEIGGDSVRVHLMTVDMAANVGIGVLTPGSVAAADEPTAMAEEATETAENAEVVGVINGDFFNNDEDDSPGGYTNAPVGPVIDAGKALKAAVPCKQRMGPPRPRPAKSSRRPTPATSSGRPTPSTSSDTDGKDGCGTNNEDVFGITPSGAPAISRLTLIGEGGFTVPGGGGFEIKGLNQYAIPVDGIGVFTNKWGAAPRKRAVCGDDKHRESKCVDDVREVHLDAYGRVTSVSDEAGEGEIAQGARVLLGREAGAKKLRRYSEGDHLNIRYDLKPTEGNPTVTTALGGMPIVRDGEKLKPLPKGNPSPRTAVGYDASGDTLYMVVVDGKITVPQLVNIMIDLGSHDVVNFDGGGSSVLGTADGSGKVTARNTPTDWIHNERRVGNALAVYRVDKRISGLTGAWHAVPSDAAPELFLDETGNMELYGLGLVPYRGTLKLANDAGKKPWTYTAQLEPTKVAGVEGTAGPLTARMSFDPDSGTLTADFANGEIRRYQR